MNDNKLIAEFMGAKPLVLGGSTEYEMYGVLDCIEDGVDEKHYYIDDEMRFHESWDWLMPVVRKIEDGGLDPHELIDKALESRVIEDTYNEVVDTIKRYNNGSTRTS